ncbi:ubiquinol oxidase subunit II [Candidimonas humi]|uniref:Ubiquinol oxidase subunit 2 n=1 Tax=Candidimonas humi TaxID=683355 RepID=A0ABV8NT91_9BURK|nr:ubiquinol oxidase subunit II [Candidimonas humi]MBV6305833.1 ubiquinol oxidase subunit II [Candidimonas humi]
MPLPKPPRRLLLLPLLAATLLLSGCNAVLLSPSGDVAIQQRNLIIVSTALMLLIIVPVIFFILLFAWRYRASNQRDDYDPEWSHSTRIELMIWSAPLVIIIALGAITWVGTHKLDPYRPLDRLAAGHSVPANLKPLEVDVVSMDWKWLFIYPELGVATVNELAAPVDRPLQFKLTSSTVMNAFFVPALAGMIYTMPGMETQLNAVINKTGTYQGMSANYSGAGFSDMNFKFYGMSTGDFDKWVAQVRSGGDTLDRKAYLELDKPSKRDPVRHYGHVEAGLYRVILNRCVDSKHMCLDQMAAIDERGGMGLPGMANVASELPEQLRLGLADSPARKYVGAICTARNPAGAVGVDGEVS